MFCRQACPNIVVEKTDTTPLVIRDAVPPIVRVTESVHYMHTLRTLKQATLYFVQITLINVGTYSIITAINADFTVVSSNESQ